MAFFVDRDNNVWLAGNDANDSQILKFTADGKFLMQIGKAGPGEGSNSKTQLGRPAGIEIDQAADELYVADGYGNRRVIVFDSRTGAYKRHWGAYGNRPDDGKMPAYDPKAPPSQQFGSPVHCARPSRDGLVYVCDRVNDRVQVVPQGRQLCKGIQGRARHAAKRLGMGFGAVARPAAEIPVHGRRAPAAA